MNEEDIFTEVYRYIEKKRCLLVELWYYERLYEHNVAIDAYTSIYVFHSYNYKIYMIKFYIQEKTW